MFTTRTRIVAILFVTVAGLVQARDLVPDSRIQEHSTDDEAHLAAALQDIEAEDLERAGTGRPWSRKDKRKLVTGAVNFFRPFPGGNGRSCATGHG
jgi:hypothetical protein